MSLGCTPVDDLGRDGVKEHVLLMTFHFAKSHEPLKRVTERRLNGVEPGMWIEYGFMQAAGTPAQRHQTRLQALSKHRLVALGHMLVQVAHVGLEPIPQRVMHGLRIGELLERCLLIVGHVQRNAAIGTRLPLDHHYPRQYAAPELQLAEPDP